MPSNVEISQFHKRLVELFDNLNNKSEDFRKYCSLQNTSALALQLFTDECKYLKEINDTYLKAGTQKKVKEALLHNLKNMQKILDEKVQTSTKRLNDCRSDYKKVQTEFE